MDWDQKNQMQLEHTEQMMLTLHKLSRVENEWLKEIRENFDPDSMDEELAERLGKLMWQFELIHIIVCANKAGEAFNGIMRWVRDLGPKGILIEEYDDEQDLDDIALAAAKVKLDRERYERGTEGEGP